MNHEFVGKLVAPFQCLYCNKVMGAHKEIKDGTAQKEEEEVSFGRDDS